MLRIFRLLLPALVPSWRFFDVIAASVRIEFTQLGDPGDLPENWQEFRPRPARLSIVQSFRSLFWNPFWNESLFLVSCAERLLDVPTDHSVREICARIRRDFGKTAPFLQFRIILIDRDGALLRKKVAYLSPVFAS